MSDLSNVRIHQAYQGMPRLGTPFVDANGQISIPWYRFLISLWARIGKGFSQQSTAIFGAAQADGTVEIFDSNTGALIGTVVLSGVKPAPAQPQGVSVSPFIFEATIAGTLVVFDGRAELSRDRGATWYPITLNGAAIPMLTGDQVRVIWYSSTTPQVTFFPSLVNQVAG